MHKFGMFLVGLCVVWLLVAFRMETTIWTGGETIGEGQFATYIPRQQVHNIGLIEQRQSHMMFAGLGLLIGTVLIGFGSISSRKGRVPCEECAELIQEAAVKCRFCGASQQIHHTEQADEEPFSSELVDDLGVSKSGDRYYYLHMSFDSLDEAVAYAKAHDAVGSA